jgi:hypothetical protein
MVVGLVTGAGQLMGLVEIEGGAWFFLGEAPPENPNSSIIESQRITVPLESHIYYGRENCEHCGEKMEKGQEEIK